jgi:uncharacterized protein Smg (DUF494 family)
MRARLAEILVLVIDRLLDDPQALEDFDGMVDALVERGVTAGEARQALAWLLSALREGQGGEETRRWERTPAGVHVLDRDDRAALSLDAQGLLIELRELGLLDDILVEQVVERAHYRGNAPLGRDELRSVVAEVLLDAAAMTGGSYPYWEAFEGEDGVVH